MTFVIVNKDLDLSVGSTFGLISVVFSMAFAAPFYDLGPVAAIVICLILGTVIGLINGALVTILQVPAFIATLTMLLIGRGIVLGLTGGKSILYSAKAREFPLFFHLGERNFLGFNNQILIALVVIRSAPMCSARPAGATRPSRPAATSRPRTMPGFRPAG